MKADAAVKRGCSDHVPAFVTSGNGFQIPDMVMVIIKMFAALCTSVDLQAALYLSHIFMVKVHAACRKGNTGSGDGDSLAALI